MITVYIYSVLFVPGLLCVNPCNPGLYGEHCDKTCSTNCRSHVNNQTYCNKDTGTCLSGCVSGRWGSQCQFPCSKNCVDHVCVHQTGRCSKGCTEYYRGDLCEEHTGTNRKTPTEEPSGTDAPEVTHSDKSNIKINIIAFVAYSAIYIALVIALAIVVAIGVYVVSLCRKRRILQNENRDTNSSWKSERLILLEPQMLTDLHDASYWGDVHRVNSILSEGEVDINSVDTYGRTPVMWSARHGQKEVFDFLVSKGANLSLTDKSGNNMLHSACHGGHMDIVQYILSHGTVEINSKDRYGRTAAMIAASKDDIDVLELLVRNGADLSLVDDVGNTVRHVTSIRGRSGIVENALSYKTTDINSNNKDGITATAVRI